MAADGTVPESELTPEERVDTAIASARYGQIGVGSLGRSEQPAGIEWMGNGYGEPAASRPG